MKITALNISFPLVQLEVHSSEECECDGSHCDGTWLALGWVTRHSKKVPREPSTRRSPDPSALSVSPPGESPGESPVSASGSSLSNAAQGATDLLGASDTVPASAQVCVHQDPQVLFCKSYSAGKGITGGERLVKCTDPSVRINGILVPLQRVVSGKSCVSLSSAARAALESWNQGLGWVGKVS